MAWEFENITRSFTFKTARASVSINDQRPCGLNSASVAIDDVDEAYVFENEDEVRIRHDAGSGFVTVARGDALDVQLTDQGRGLGPRRYALRIDDFTARLSDNIVTAERDVEESATARVSWIMGFSARGLNSTGVATISTVIGGHDYTGMTVRDALQQVANLVGALFYVDDDKALHFFLSESNPAPFILGRPANPPTSYPYTDFSLEQKSADLAHAVFVQGATDSIWRVAVGAPSAPDRQEAAISNSLLVTQTDMELAGDAELERRQLQRVGSLVTLQPGLRAGQQVRIVNPDWSLDDTFEISSVQTTIPGPNDVAYRVGFADHVVCRRAGSLLGQVAREARTVPVEVINNAVASSVADLSAAGANMLINSSFESSDGWNAGSGWTLGHLSGDPFHGIRVARRTGTGAGELVTADYIFVDRTDHWHVSFWSKLISHSSGIARLAIREYNAGNTLLETTNIDLDTVESKWTRHSFHFGPGDMHLSTVKLKLAFFGTSSPSFTWEVDGVQLERGQLITAYVPRPQELVDASITATQMADLAITLAKLADDSVNAAKLVDNAVTEVKIATGAIGTTKISDNAVTTPKVNAGAVTTSKLDALAVTADKIAANAVTTAKLNALAVTAEKIAANAIVAAKIAAGAIETDKLAANAVVAGKIAAGAVTTAKLDAAAVNADKLAAGAVQAEHIGSQSVFIGKLAQDAGNLVTNPGFELGQLASGTTVDQIPGWGVLTGTVNDIIMGAVNARSGTRSLVIRHNSDTSTTKAAIASVDAQVAVNEQRRYRLRGWVRGTTANAKAYTIGVGVSWRDAGGAQISLHSFGFSMPADNTYREATEVVTPPAGAVFARIRLAMAAGGGTVTDDLARFDDIEFYPADQDVDHAAGDVRIDGSGITVTNGRLVVSNPGATVIIDGTSNMFKIIASGTISVSVAAGDQASQIVGLSGLGAQSVSLAMLGFVGTSGSTRDQRGIGSRRSFFDQRFVAGASGGPTVQAHFLANREGRLETRLNSSTDVPEVVLRCLNSGSVSWTFEARYHLLKEAAI